MHSEQNALSALFVFAHPDDEFFCLPFIRRELVLGHEVICVYLTDGAYGGQSARTRIKETTAVLTKLGVAEGGIHFVGAQEHIPDGKLHLHLGLAHERLHHIAASRVLDGIYCPAWEGGHQDHDVCYALCVSMVETCGTPVPMQFSLYNAYRSPLLFNVMRELEQNGEAESIRVSWKEAIRNMITVAEYPSQWKTWLALFPFAAVRILATRRYALQKARASRLSERPHDGKLLYEKRGLVDFIEIDRAMNEFLKQLRKRY
jgi:LmbE family N-acetylglucosaminyl deacetylase